MNRLAVTATLLAPCPPSHLAEGYDMCPCGYGGSWPCPVTRAAWIARDLDPDAEVRRIIAQVQAEWACAE